jgi:hypothetical protein
MSTPDDAYRLATGQNPPLVAPAGSYLTTDQVCGALAAAGVDAAEVGKVFAARLEPQHLEDPDKKIVLGAAAPDGQVYLIVARFGLGRPLVKNHPLDESGPDWRPRFLSVEGPFPGDRKTIEAKAKELTAA